VSTHSQKAREQEPKLKCEVDISPLKRLVLKEFPRDNLLRNAVLAERDILKASEFVAKMETWQILLRMT